MPVDPDSIALGKCYVTATRHVRAVLEVTNERVRYSYGGGDAGGVGQWRWQTKAKFANDAVREVSPDDEAPASTTPRAKTERPENVEVLGSNGPRPTGSRALLSKRR